MQKQPYQYIFLLFVNRRENTAVFKPMPGEGFISISYVFVYVKEHTLKILIQRQEDEHAVEEMWVCFFAVTNFPSDLGQFTQPFYMYFFFFCKMW